MGRPRVEKETKSPLSGAEKNRQYRENMSKE